MDEDVLKSALNGTRRIGRAELVRHLQNKKLTRNQSIKAKCYDCNGMGESKECDIKECSLYPYSPYR